MRTSSRLDARLSAGTRPNHRVTELIPGEVCAGMEPAAAKTGNQRELPARHDHLFAPLLEVKRGAAARAGSQLRRRTIVRKLEPGSAIAFAVQLPDRAGAEPATKRNRHLTPK